MNQFIYLDHNTISRPSPRAVEKMLPFFKERWGAAEAPHKLGQEQIPSIDAAASAIYEALGADFSADFTFTSSGSEATAQLFLSTYLDFTRETGRNHFLTSAVEDNSITTAVKRLQKVDCFSKMLPVDQAGRLRAEALEEAIGPRVAMLSISMANALTGVIHPIADLARICNEKEVRLHVDVSNVLGKIFFSFQDSGIDFITFEGSNIHAPKGSGGLLVRKGLEMAPQIPKHQPFNTPLFVALAVAMDEMSDRIDQMCTEIARLREKFERGIVRGYSDAVVFFQDAERLPNTTAIAFPGVASEALLFQLHRKGVYATFGGGNKQHLAHVLKICGVESELAMCALSFSLSYETTEEEIDRAISIVVETALEMRKIAGALP